MKVLALEQHSVCKVGGHRKPDDIDNNPNTMCCESTCVSPSSSGKPVRGLTSKDKEETRRLALCNLHSAILGKLGVKPFHGKAMIDEI